MYPYTNSTENNFTPIGNYYPNPSFQGTFDGDGHIISGIRINGDYNQGLFGEISGTVKNVILADAIIIGSGNIGGIAGYNNNGTLENNLVIGTTISATDDNSHGAICGSNYGTLEHNYYVGCTVAGVENATGVGCGYIYDDDEENYITADITENGGAMPGNARTVEGYSDSEEVGWTFIASPLTEDTDPATTAVQNIFSASEYDLYRLNPSSVMWENYKPGNVASGFSLENGRGYLYATQEQETVKFIGTTTSAYNLNDTEDVTLGEGFNLVGNPFPRAAYINKPYYTLNLEGSAVLTETSTGYISPCKGVVVEASDNETVTFRTTPFPQQTSNNNGNLKIALTQANTRSNALLDRTIVSFNEGSQLGKFYFGQQDANIYIPQDGKEYAIVCASRDGVHTVSTATEMPVNFKAHKNGEYTITVNPKGVEMAYLHLIDNMTGNDIDLLQTPSYSFDARTTDYESRFKLVFSANGVEGNDDFAFIDSNGEIHLLIETCQGASLQIIDALGRIITNVGLSQCGSPTAGMAPGVYVLRLINGDNVKTQKIVIK